MIAALEPTLSPRDIAGLTGLSYASVLAEIHEGRLRAKLVRGHYIVLPEHYQAWLEPDAPAPQRASAIPPRRSTGRSGGGSVEQIRALEDAARGGRS